SECNSLGADLWSFDHNHRQRRQRDRFLHRAATGGRLCDCGVSSDLALAAHGQPATAARPPAHSGLYTFDLHFYHVISGADDGIHLTAVPLSARVWVQTDRGGFPNDALAHRACHGCTAFGQTIRQIFASDSGSAWSDHVRDRPCSGRYAARTSVDPRHMLAHGNLRNWFWSVSGTE